MLCFATKTGQPRIYVSTAVRSHEGKERNMLNKGIRIRWVTTTTFEVVLPSGKVILFDPWVGNETEEFMGPGRKHEIETKLEDISGADWIFISHAHFDHCADVTTINRRFMEGTNGGRIFMPALSAYKLALHYDVPFRDILPVYPNETFDFDEFTITALPCRHRGDPVAPSESRRKALERGQTEEMADLGDIGNLDEIDWAVTIKENNIRFMVLAGGLYHFNNTPEFCRTFNPMFVTRQVSNIIAKDPQTYAKYCHMFHAPFVFPSHHDLGIYKSYKEYAPFFKAVNEELEKMGSITRVLDTERGKWYEIGGYLELK